MELSRALFLQFGAFFCCTLSRISSIAVVIQGATKLSWTQTRAFISPENPLLGEEKRELSVFSFVIFLRYLFPAFWFNDLQCRLLIPVWWGQGQGGGRDQKSGLRLVELRFRKKPWREVPRSGYFPYWFFPIYFPTRALTSMFAS